MNLNRQISICNKIIGVLQKETDEQSLSEYMIESSAEVLLAILDRVNNEQVILDNNKILRPSTLLSRSTLFTGSMSEPSLVSELKKEILTSDSIDMLMAFIKWSSLRMIMDELHEFTKEHSLRIITTSYMGATDYRTVLKNQNFGDLWTGDHRPAGIKHLFMSIQTFNSKEFEKHTAPDFYDYIIVDGFHHSEAPSYQKLLEYYKPKILLGLTATPEMMGGQDILKHFDYRIAAEIRLGEAIDRKLLSPFQYFGVTDNVDLDHLRWSRGGYDIGQLENIYTENTQRSRLIISAIDKYVTDIDEVIGIGYCVSIKHAEYMADFFNKCGIRSICIHGGSSQDERSSGQEKLRKKDINFIFTVDLYNEEIDIPEVNTVLFLRPAESVTTFLQQLGSGLRLCEGKDCLTVIDFIGQAHKNYNFEEKFKALLGWTDNSAQKEITYGFPNLPKGCFIQLEKYAQKNILDNRDRNVRLTEEEEIMLSMLHYAIWQEQLNKLGMVSIKSSLTRLKENRELYEEIKEILKINYEKINFIDQTVELGFPCPMDLHCTYSKDEILAALGYYTLDKKPAQSGDALYMPEKKIDVLFITLNKSEKDYSPSTLYDDYAIDEELFRWQSQGTASEASQTGQRYINHNKLGSKVLLFMREYKKENGVTSPYYYLGTANYVSHTGSRPMSIVWRLDRPMPEFLVKKAGKMTAG